MDGRACGFHSELRSSFTLCCGVTGLLPQQSLQHSGVRGFGAGAVRSLGIGGSPLGSIVEEELNGWGLDTREVSRLKTHGIGD